MPATVVPDDFCSIRPEANADACRVMRTLAFEYPNLLCRLVEYLLDPTGMPSEDFRNDLGIIPAGIITPFGGLTPPSTWLLCDGAEYSRETYARLFAVIGTLYGAGDGATTFNVPNIQGRNVLGAQAGFFPSGSTGGSASKQILPENLPNESVRYPIVVGLPLDEEVPEDWVGQLSSNRYVPRYEANQTAVAMGLTFPLGEGLPMTQRDPYLALAYIIKA